MPGHVCMLGLSVLTRRMHASARACIEHGATTPCIWHWLCNCFIMASSPTAFIECR
jgi:hypothetical protein